MSRKRRRTQVSAGRARKRRRVARAPFRGRYAGTDEELKFHDRDIADITVPATLFKYNLNIIPQNSTESGRIGRKLVIKTIQVQGNVQLIAATNAANTSNILKWSIVLDTQTNGAAFSSTVYLKTDDIRSYRSLSNTGRFKVLKTGYITLAAKGAAPSGAAFIFSEDMAWLNCYIKCNVPIEYDTTETDGTVGTQRVNSLWFVTQMTEAEIIAINLKARMRFSDG